MRAGSSARPRRYRATKSRSFIPVGRDTGMHHRERSRHDLLATLRIQPRQGEHRPSKVGATPGSGEMAAARVVERARARYRDRDAGGDGGVHDGQDGERGGADIAEDELPERTPGLPDRLPDREQYACSYSPFVRSGSHVAISSSRRRRPREGSHERLKDGIAVSQESVRLRRPARTGACRSASGRPQGLDRVVGNC
jgi:hypothetical protein